MKDINKRQFEKLYEKYRSAVFSNALLYTKSKEAAEDIMQTVFLELYETLSKKENIPERLGGWIIKLTKYRSLNYLSSNKSSVTITDNIRFTEGPERITEERTLIEKALSVLSESELEIFNLKVLAGFKHREIAQALELNPSTVRWQYTQAVKKLKTALNSFEKHSGGII